MLIDDDLVEVIVLPRRRLYRGGEVYLPGARFKVTDDEYGNLRRNRDAPAVAYADPKTVAIVEDAIRRGLPEVYDLQTGRVAYEPPTGDERDAVAADPVKLGRRVAERKAAKKTAARKQG